MPRDEVHQGVPAQPDEQLDHADRDSGSGFLLTADGEILTNQHVVDGAERLNVKLADGRSLRARVIGADPDTDVALIKVDGVSGLPVAELGDSSTLRPGEWVCAIGNPLAYEHTVTVGVVSSLGRKLFDESFDDYIQTDAAIDFGNSGGPLINAAGQVIGINTAISSEGNDIGFAVPINQAREILGPAAPARARDPGLHRRQPARRRRGPATLAPPRHREGRARRGCHRRVSRGTRRAEALRRHRRRGRPRRPGHVRTHPRHRLARTRLARRAAGGAGGARAGGGGRPGRTSPARRTGIAVAALAGGPGQEKARAASA